MKEPQAMTIIPTMQISANAMLYLKFLRILGSSLKKFEFSASLLVEPCNL